MKLIMSTNGKQYLEVQIFEDIEKADGLVLSTERRIDMLLTLKPGDYSCFFNVTDKETGVCWSTPFYLRVKSMTSEGLDGIV